MTQDSEVEEHLQLQARRGGGGARLCSLLRSTLQGCTVTDSPDADDPFNIQPLHHFQLQQILSNISEQDLSLAENVLQVDDTDIVPEKSIQESMEMDNMSEMFKENAQNGISYNKDLRREGSVTKKRPLDEDSRTFGSDLNIQNNVSVDEYIEAANQSYDNILKGSCKNRGTRREGSGRLITKKPYDIFSSSAGTESKFQFDNVIYEDVEEYFRAAERHEIANAIKRKMKGEKTPDSPTYDSQKRRPRRQGTGRKIVARNFDVDLPDFAASYAEIDKEELQTEEERLINTFISSSRKSPILLTDAECNESNSKGVCNTVGMEELLALKVKQDDRHSLKNQHSIMEDLIILKSLEDQGASTSLELQQVESTMANKDVFKFTEEKVNNSMEFVQANGGMEANCIPLVDTSPSIEEPSNCEIVNSPVKLVPANELTEGSRIPETDALQNSEEPSQCHIVNSPKLVQVDEQIISGSVPTTGLEKEFIENSDNRLYTTLLQSQTASSDPMGAQSFTNELDDMSHLSQQLADCLAAAEPLPDNLVSASADGRNDINSQIVSPSKMCIDEQPHDDSVKISQAENSCATLSQPLVCSSVQQNDNFPSLGILNTSPSSSHLKSGLKKLRKSLDFSSHVVDHNSGLFYPAATCLENKHCSPQQKKSCMSSSAQPFQMQDQHEVNSQSKSDASRDDACVELMQIDVRHDKATSDCGVSAIDEEKEESVAKSVRRNAKRKKMKSPLVIKQPLITHNGEQNVNNMETTAKDKGKRRKKRESQRRPSLVGAGSLWKSGVRRSTRIRSRPLEYWRGERFLYGRIHESLATVIGIKYSSPVTSKSKLKEVPKLKVRSFVDDKYSDLLELASKC